MHRLLNLKSQAVLSAVCLPSLIDGGCIPENSCKAYPGSSDWPSTGLWNTFNITLGGRLFQPTPPGAVCHEGWPTYDPARCPAVASNWSTYEFHTNNPISVIIDVFSNDTCLAKPDFPCSASGYPAYVINATTPEHVKAGVDFARSNNVRLIVKNTGHDYIGRSIAPGALSIWTHHLNDILIHEKEFKLDGCDITIEGTAFTVGAGAQMWDIYSATDAINQTIVGGGGKSVGIGGYITGGGHSILSPRYGLAADQVLQMEMVTPGGDIITINEKQHSDLFWAMRGGGGSTFGVLTSVTLKTHPTPKIASSGFILATDADGPFVYDMLTFSLSSLPKLGKAGLSGYTFSSTRIQNPFPSPGAPAEIAGILGVFILQDTTDLQLLNNVLGPLNDTIQERWKGAVQFYQTPKTYDSFLGWYLDHYDKGTAGNDSYIVSRLLDEEALQSKDLIDAVKSATLANGGLSAFLLSGKGVHDAQPRGGNDAVNPGWRTSYVHALTSISFPPLNQTAKKEAIAILNKSFEPMRKLAPNTGAYVNEALPFENDWQHTFWGENYERLLSIKREVDPQDVFWCFPCVGSEGWEQRQDGRLCKVE